MLIVDRWETTLEGDRQALSQLVDYIFLKYNAALVDAHYSCVFIPDSENVGEGHDRQAAYTVFLYKMDTKKYDEKESD